MRFLVTWLFVSAAIFVVCMLILAAPEPEGRISAAQIERANEDTDPATKQFETRVVRVVSPERFASPLARDLTDLERIKPREPFSRPQEEKERVKVVMLSRPRSVASGLVIAQGRRVQFANVVPIPTTRLCATGDGEGWPCGMMALTHQRMLLRNRPITCEHDGADWQGTLVTECYIGNVNVGSWLVEHGWAEASPESALSSLEADARKKQEGLHGPDPR